MIKTVFIIVIICLLILFVLPQVLTNSAIKSVLQILRKHNAVNNTNAKTIEGLGLNPGNIAKRMVKPRALNLMINANLAQMTEDNKIYLSEENLAATQWKDI